MGDRRRSGASTGRRGKHEEEITHDTAWAVSEALGRSVEWDGTTNSVYIGDVPPAITHEKPVIYLYPTEKTQVAVQLTYAGVLDVTYPAYGTGWNVTAHPDGTLLNHADGREYSYLFWEGTSEAAYDFTEGFVVKGSDTVSFLQEKLSYMGLTPKEYNEFIVYWLPKLQDNPYNLISFQGDSYTETAVLKITPEPDSMLRVFMAVKPLEAPVDLPEQELVPFVRTGFAVVEWGGSLEE